MDVSIILQLFRSVRFRNRFPGNVFKKLENNLCEWFLWFTITDAIEILLELNSVENKERKWTTLQQMQADEIFPHY